MSDEDKEQDGAVDHLAADASVESGGHGRLASLAGFLFGNIDDAGRLVDDDILDEECRQHLEGLEALGAINSMVEEITDESEVVRFVDEKADASAGGSDGESADVVPFTPLADDTSRFFDRKISVDEDDYDDDGGGEAKAEDAVDYSDINEVVDDADGEVSITEKTVEDANDGSQTSMPPPLKIPQHFRQPSDKADDVDKNDSVKIQSALSIETSRAQQDEETSSSSMQSPMTPRQSVKTPLAALRPPELADVDVCKWFPEFQSNKVLRFSRLFRPTNMPHIWKRKKRKNDIKEEPINGHEAKAKKTSSDPEPTAKENEPPEENQDALSSAVKIEPGEKFYHDLDGQRLCPFTLNLGRPAHREELLPDDEELLTSADYQPTSKRASNDKNADAEPTVADWRYGPARLWYDMIGVKESGEGFDYGFKLKSSASAENGSEQKQDQGVHKMPSNYPDDAFHMVTQTLWEDDVIWNGEESRPRVLESARRRGSAAGWIPSTNIRSMHQYWQQISFSSTLATERHMASQLVTQFSEVVGPVDNWYSVFPIENEALLYGKWEDDVIWDAQAMDRIPQPPVLMLDPNDEHLILEMPEDVDPKLLDASLNASQSSQDLSSKKESKRSKMLLGKSGTSKDEDEPDQEDDQNLSLRNKDSFNLSNDDYYYPKLSTDAALGRSIGGSVIQHSTPAVELFLPFFPTHMGPTKLRNFHRPPLKRYSHGVMAGPGPHPVMPLLKHIRRKEKLREQERLASGGGEMFFMRTPEDLTGRDGDLVLMEYSEQFPALMNQVGMASKIKNYYKRKPGKDSNIPKFRFGEIAYAHTSPFLGSIPPGHCLQAVENNMFRAPIFEHQVPQTDFLVIRTRLHYHIREVETIFTVGQECPLIEVPGPNSKRANNFLRDFLQVFVYRLFWSSRDVPRRIKMEDVRKAFPSHSESSIRKRLKLCADFKRTGTDSNWWVLKADFRLPTEEEIRASVSAEQCCAFYSMLAAEQRLKDAGYGERSLFAPEDDDEDSATKIEDEVKVAPWNTTRAFISAMKGRCLLALTGVADPTGCGEGFSYVKVPNKPAASRSGTDEVASHHTPVKRIVTGTDADLRRLSLKDAKNLLRKFGVAESEIKKLSRWEVIHVVRTMSTEQAKAAASQEDPYSGFCKFARGNRFSVAEHQERYKEECQRIFDLQNRILGSNEVLSTDDDSSSEDSDFEEISRNIESMLSNKKTSRQINLEREEAERLELRRLIQEGGALDSKDKKMSKSTSSSAQQQSPVPNGVRKLRISRTFRSDDGREYTRTEIVSKQNVIDIYIRIRETKDPNFIKQFAAVDEQAKEEMKKERRRIQEQLRRIKRIQETGSGARHSVSRESLPGQTPSKKHKQLTPLKLAKLLKAQKMKCGACGQSGHMRTNRECPLYTGGDGPLTGDGFDERPSTSTSLIPGTIALSVEQEKQLERSELVDEDLINIEGIKMKISKQLVMHTEKVKKRSLVLKFPKVAAAAAAAAAKKRRRGGGVGPSSAQCDYLKKLPKANRRRADPVVSLSTMLEGVLNEMRDLPNVGPFLYPVNAKQVPDYYTVVRRPMDLQTIRDNLRARKYVSREAFLIDVGQIVDNCSRYNGPRHALTATAQRMLDLCLQRVAEKEEKLMRLEKAINPLLDEDDKKAIKYLVQKIVDENLKTVEGSYAFHNPVNRKEVKNYYDVIKSPMDLSTIHKKAEEFLYRSRADFLADLELMVANCEKFNGPLSPLTQTAHKILNAARIAVNEVYAENFNTLEENIRATQQAALDAADTDSVVTGTSAATGGDVESLPKSSGRGGTKRGRGRKTAGERNISNSLRAALDEGDADAEEEEEVDVVGEAEEAEESSFVGVQRNADTLAHDLQLSPENSDDDDDDDGEPGSPPISPSQSVGRRSSDDDDGDFENVDDEMVAIAADGDDGTAMAIDASYMEYDMNAQDFVSYVDIGEEGMDEQAASYNGAGEFDPQEFFNSLEIGAGQGLPISSQDSADEPAETSVDDINNDLEISESDSESEAGFVAVDDDGENVDVAVAGTAHIGAASDDENIDYPEFDNDDADFDDNQDFDMNEFLKQS